MIKHIVMFRFKNVEINKREANAKSLIKVFSPLIELECVKSYRVGINISNSEFAYDVVIDSEFESVDDLNAYQVSPEHKKAIADASVYKKEKCVIDYQF